MKNVSNSWLHSAPEMTSCLFTVLWPNMGLLQDEENLPMTKCYYDYLHQENETGLELDRNSSLQKTKLCTLVIYSHTISQRDRIPLLTNQRVLLSRPQVSYRL